MGRETTRGARGPVSVTVIELYRYYSLAPVLGVQRGELIFVPGSSGGLITKSSGRLDKLWDCVHGSTTSHMLAAQGKLAMTLGIEEFRN